MSRVWTLCIMDSQKVKGQGHNARITEKGFWRIAASPLHLSWWNFTCSSSTSWVWTLWTLGSKGQRSRSQCKDYWKRILAHNCFPFTPILMKLHMQSPHESSMDPMDFGVKRSKVKVTLQGLLKMVSGTLLLPLYTYLYETSHAVSPWVEYGTYGLWGQKVKGQGHIARITEKGFWCITASPLHLHVSSWNFTCSLPMSQVWTLWTLGSKGQRSRSQCKDYCKRFLAHNCFPYLVHNLESLNWLPRGVFCPVRTAPF